MLGVGLQLAYALPRVHRGLVGACSYCCAALACGCLFGVQAKMNKRLARDLGSTARAAAFCGYQVLIWGTPVWLVLLLGMGIPLYFRAEDWWIWALCGMQNAFYTYTLAELPKIISYSTVFICVQAGKLLTAAAADTSGLFAPAVALSPWRCASISCMITGAVLYSFENSSEKPRLDEPGTVGSFIETVSVLGEIGTSDRRARDEPLDDPLRSA